MADNISKPSENKMILRLLTILTILLSIVVILQLVNTKYAHDNTYRLSHIVKNTGDTTNAINKWIKLKIAE